MTFPFHACMEGTSCTDLGSQGVQEPYLRWCKTYIYSGASIHKYPLNVQARVQYLVQILPYCNKRVMNAIFEQIAIRSYASKCCR